MKDINYYRDAGKYPSQPIKPTIKSIGLASSAQLRSYADAIEAYEKEMENYEEELHAYQVRKNNLEEEFQKDLIEENDLTGHPKAALLYIKAWDHGHASGLDEVMYWFNDLAELLR